MSKQPAYRFDTRLIHAGEPSPRLSGAVVMPIFQSSTYNFGGEGSYHDVRYIRLNNTPNHVVLHDKLAALEGGEAALVAASGMAAISTSLLALLKAGDHLLSQDCLYGGTRSLLSEDLRRLGIECTFVDAGNPESWRAALRPNTRAFYCETMTNPLLEVADLPGIAAFSREHGLVSLIDNTLASPLNFRPLSHGFHLSLHSCTKFLNGHTDIVAGAVIGSAELVGRVKHRLDHLGGTLDPHACFLLHRGMKTLALRMRQQNHSALEIARFLSEHPRVARVHYAGLPSHPSHARAKALLDGFGGLLSFELKSDLDGTLGFLEKMTLPIQAPSLGGVESLLTRPVTTSHAGLPEKERLRLGITDQLIRMSVGIEDTRDLIDDLKQALD